MTRMLLAALLAAQAATLPPPFPRDGAKKLIDNERVTVWEVTWPRGVKTPMHRHPFPTVGVVLDPGALTMTLGDGTVRETTFTEPGQAVFAPAGFTHVEEGRSATPARAVIVELKGTPGEAAAAPAGVPPAFPRDGATKLLENERVTVWNVTWPGGSAPTHFHASDVVVVGIEVGTTRSTPLRGQPSTTAWKFGDVRFNPRGRVHREEVVAGAPRIVAVEVK
jgi:quercetin dioxygenase-like cupin family protein